MDQANNTTAAANDTNDTNNVNWQVNFLLGNKKSKSKKGVFVYQESKRCINCGEKLPPSKANNVCGNGICLNFGGC